MTDSLTLNYQLDMLKLEIETINSSIRQMDEISKSVKEWTVGLWTASLGTALATKDLNVYVMFTAIIPILFCFVDVWYRRIQRKFIWRSMQISRFLNDERLSKSFDAKKLIDFKVFNVIYTEALSQEERKEFKAFTSWRIIISFPSLNILYVGLITLSLILGTFQIFKMINL